MHGQQHIKKIVIDVLPSKSLSFKSLSTDYMRPLYLYYMRPSYLQQTFHP